VIRKARLFYDEEYMNNIRLIEKQAEEIERKMQVE
jgi:hypothetical protein